VFIRAVEEDGDMSLTETDRAHLKALETWLDCIPRRESPRSSRTLSAFWERPRPQATHCRTPVAAGRRQERPSCREHSRLRT
jgi:hypothetical protein